MREDDHCAIHSVFVFTLRNHYSLIHDNLHVGREQPIDDLSVASKEAPTIVEDVVIPGLLPTVILEMMSFKKDRDFVTSTCTRVEEPLVSKKHFQDETLDH